MRPPSKQANAAHRPEPSIEERFADEARFFRAWFENPKRTGAVSPSGRFLARTMARYVDPSTHGPIVELGPGTGPVTQALIRRGVAPERLILVEYDPAFCRLLQRRFPHCRVVRGDAYALDRTLRGVLSGPVAAVVSSLPLLTRPETERLALLDQAFGLMGPDGCFVQFTYGMGSPIPRGLRAAAQAFAAETSPPIWLNLPPARVWVYRPAGAPASHLTRRSGKLIDRLKQGADKARDDFKGKCEQVERELRLRARFARRELAYSAKTRGGRPPHPALALIKKLGDPRDRLG